jgi:hypothetical protein
MSHILLNEYYDFKLNDYIKEHPGEWLFLVEKGNPGKEVLQEEDVQESFFKRKSDLERFIGEKYKKTVGYTYLRARIPDPRR